MPYSVTHGRSEPLGASLSENGVNFAVSSENATAVEVCLFDDDRETCLVLPGRTGHVFHGHVAGLKAGQRYGLRAYGPFAPENGQRFDAEKLLFDPYALAIDRAFALDDSMTVGNSTVAMPKAIVAQPEQAAAPPKVPWPDTVIYELHVRGFTKLMPGVPEAQRGTFAGLAHPAAVQHLKALGITTVELLPCMAWIDEPHLKRKGLSNYWGYNPIGWCVPDPRLAPGGWTEVRKAVAELGKAGIEVILDVVYNHSGEGDELGPTVSLRGLDNAGYYRLAENKALYVNDAGTGNILDAEKPAVVRLIMDSLRAWAVYGGMAGFRFDLAATLGRRQVGFDAAAPLLAAIAQDPILRELKVIAEPWDCGPGGYQVGGFPAPWVEWNDRYRDDVRRFWRGDGMALGALATRLSGSSDIFGGRPVATSLNFITAHDGFTLRDLVGYDGKQNTANGEDNRDGTDQNYSWVSGDPARDQRNLLATLILSRGTPMLSMGAESGQSQGGNNNAYCQDNATSWLDWAKADDGLTAFCVRLIALRRDHPALRGGWLSGEITDGDWPDAMWTRSDGAPLTEGDWNDPHGPTLVATLCQGVDRVCVIIHRNYDRAEVRLPPLDGGHAWNVSLDTADDSRAGPTTGPVNVAPRSIVVLIDTSSATARSGLDDHVLDALSHAAGIQPNWWNIAGRQTQVPRDSKRHILAALGLDCATNAEARDSLRRLSEDHDRRPLPFSHVHHGDGRIVLALAGSVTNTWLTFRDEAGQTHRVRATGEVRPHRGRDGRMAGVVDVNLGTLPPGRYSVRREDHPNLACRLTVAPAAAWMPPELDRPRFGLSAQLYAMRRDGDQGIGDFTTLGDLLDLAKASGAACLAINPLHALFPDNRDRASPYYPSDRRFIDPIWLDVGDGDAGGQIIDYTAVWARKDAILRARFVAEKADPAFTAFVEQGGDGLRLFAAFEAKGGDPAYPMYLQWLCERQLAQAVTRGEGMAIGLLRDLAIGAAPDGAEAVTLSAMIARGVSLGAPPDPFSADGQVWGIPPFSPSALSNDGYETIASIYRANMRHAGALRIDHAIGLMRQFWVPDGADGKDGAYIRFPYADLLGQLKLESQRAKCLIVGEDLGTVPEGFREQMNAAGILSFKVMPFEREGVSFRPSASYPRESLACAATHDLPPLKGWWDGLEISERRTLGLDVANDAEATRQKEKAELLAVLEREGLLSGADADGPLTVDIAAAVHAFIARTPALLAIVQVEDLAASAVPVNLPGTDRERPNWRHRLPATLEAVFDSPWAKALLDAARSGRG